jgi:energy-coupling factor transporter transmembrane protein EcfT
MYDRERAMLSTIPSPVGGVARAFDPRAKLIAYALATALVLATTRPAALLAIMAVLVGLLAAVRLGRQGLAVGRGLLPMLLFVAVIVYLTGGGAAAAAGAVLRLAALTTAGVLFFGATAPEELGEALLRWGLAPRYAFLLEGTLRFVPTMARLWGEVRDAQASRGVRFDGWRLLRHGPALLGPLLVSALRFADDLTEALEARGFAAPTRPPLRDYRFARRDWLLMLAAALLCGLGAVWALAG